MLSVFKYYRFLVWIYFFNNRFVLLIDLTKIIGFKKMHIYTYTTYTYFRGNFATQIKKITL